MDLDELLTLNNENQNDPRLREHFPILVQGLVNPDICGTIKCYQVMGAVVNIVKEPGVLDLHDDVFFRVMDEMFELIGTEADPEKKKVIDDCVTALFGNISSCVQVKPQLLMKHLSTVLASMMMEGSVKWVGYGMVAPLMMGNVSAFKDHVDSFIRVMKVFPQTLSVINSMYKFKPESFESNVPDLVVLYQNNPDSQSSIMQIFWEISKRNADCIVPHLEQLKSAMFTLTTATMYGMMLQEVARKFPEKVKPLVPELLQAMKFMDQLKYSVPSLIGVVSQISEEDATQGLLDLWMISEGYTGDATVTSMVLGAIKNTAHQYPHLLDPYLSRLTDLAKDPSDIVRSSAQPIVDLITKTDLHSIASKVDDTHKVVKDVAVRVDSQQDHIQKIESEVEHHQEEITRVHSKLEDHSGRIDAATSASTLAQQQVQDMGGRVDQASQQAEQAHQLATTHEAQISTLDSRVTAHDGAIEVISDRIEMQNLQIQQHCKSLDDFKAYVDNNIDMVKDFVAEFAKKLPSPVRFDASGIALRTLALHFECGLKGPRCRYPGSDGGDGAGVGDGADKTFVTTTKDVAKWIKVGFNLVKIGKAAFMNNPGEALHAVMDIYNVVKKKEDQNFLAFISQPFLTSAEQDHLIIQLRNDRFFDVFEYHSKTASWCCSRCIDDANNTKPATTQAEPSTVSHSMSISITAEAEPRKENNPTKPMQVPEPTPTPIPGSASGSASGSVSGSTSGSASGSTERLEISGVLHKKGKWLGTMKKRWCVLNRDSFTWFSKREDVKALGSLSIKGILNIKKIDARVSKQPNSFTIVTKQQTILFSALDADTYEQWVTIFEKVIKASC